MFDQEDGDIGVALGVVFGILALVIALVIGVGVRQLGMANAPEELVGNGAELEMVTQRAELPREPVFIIGGSEVAFLDVAEEGELVAKIYFGLGEKELDGEGMAALEAVLNALDANPGAKALISGFHDESGGLALNAEVAAARAVAVRNALLNARIEAERIILRRPAEALGGRDRAEARRVEIRVQD